MPAFSCDKEIDKKRIAQLMFWFVTLVLLITRYAIFYGYKGSDDLHYAFLSSEVLNGNYDLFFANDIYSGRVVVVLYQALWFKMFGINDFSVCMPSISVLIILAYLVCFKCGLQKNLRTALLGSSLIYFNPVVTRATLGNLPDVYIGLIAVLVFVIIKNNIEYSSKRQNIFWGVIAALLLITGFFVKESIVLIYVGVAVLLVYFRKKISKNFVKALIPGFFIGSAAYLMFYYINTGDFFYRFVQIKNAAYFNGCSYQCLPKIDLLKRLTITVPLVAVLTSAYPLLLSTTVLFGRRLQSFSATGYWKITFISLFILALYFPFSIAPYIPLCHDMRQFFFLFSFAVIIYLAHLQDVMMVQKELKKNNITGSIVFVSVILISLFFTPYNKWGIFCNGLLSLIFIINIFSNKKLNHLFLFLAMPFILWLSTSYTIFKKQHEGYRELKRIQSELKQAKNSHSNIYYFLTNDTKTHFALINQFDTSKRFVNLDSVQNGFKPFIGYQLKNAANSPVIFRQGWLIVSENYFENLDTGRIDSVKHLLAAMNCYIKINKSSAYYVTADTTVKKIMDILNVKTADNGCY
jgi:hypothetical protein